MYKAIGYIGIKWSMAMALRNAKKFREMMRRKVNLILESEPQVGSSGRHLFEDVQKVQKMRYRQQKAWARSVHIEIKKERQRVQEESRSIDIRQQMAILQAIGKEQWNKRQQQPLMR